MVQRSALFTYLGMFATAAASLVLEITLTENGLILSTACPPVGLALSAFRWRRSPSVSSGTDSPCDSLNRFKRPLGESRRV
jgi:hypothetical protein